MKSMVALIGLLAGYALQAQEKQMCMSFDDLPVVGYGVNVSKQQAIMDKLTKSLIRNGIRAIGFVNEKKLFTSDGARDTLQVNLLTSWIDSGMDLGNHTYSHPDYNNSSFAFFTNDLVKGETVTRELLTARGKTLKYFRHPFLHVGHTKARADSLWSFLDNRNYTVAPVTIDNDDYLFAVAHKRAVERDDSVLAKRIGYDYVRYMERKVLYYEAMSDSLFGHSIRQILLVHASALNAEYVDSLAVMLRKHGYSFISMDQALEEPAYKTPVTVYGKWGISWMDKWALSQGKKGAFFRDDPTTPDYVRKLAE